MAQNISAQPTGPLLSQNQGGPPAKKPPTSPTQGYCLFTICAFVLLVGIIIILLCIYFQFLVNITLLIFAILAVAIPIILYLVPRAALDPFLQKGDKKIATILTRFKFIGYPIIFLRKRLKFISAILNVILILSILYLLAPAIYQYLHRNDCSNGLCLSTAQDGEPIGINDGTLNSDFWSGNDTNNAEKLIYQANSKIPPGDPYITIVLATTLSGDIQSIGKGHDDLQGAYVLQEQINGNGNISCPLSNCLKLKLLIANTGGDSAYAMQVAQQIVRVRATDKHFIGVMGWPDSTTPAIDAIRYLSAQSIPMITPSASSNALTSIPFFFRSVPLDSEQGAAAASYAESQLNAQRTALFYSPDLPYSVTLASNFMNTFNQQTGNSVILEPFDRNPPQSKQIQSEQAWENKKKLKINSDLYDALHQKQMPNMIYCACYTDDLSTLLTSLRSPSANNDPTLLVMAGDAAYQPGNLNGDNYHDLYFTAFAFPDEWGASAPDPCTSTHYDSSKAGQYAKKFLCDYATYFEGVKSHPMVHYGYNRADADAILSYDATTILLAAYVTAINKTSSVLVSASDIQQALLGQDRCSSFQGVSGAISFGLDGNAIDKAFLMLHVNSGGNTSPVKKADNTPIFLQGQAQAQSSSICNSLDW